MNKQETWDKLEWMDNDEVKIYKGNNIHYEDAHYIVISTDYDKDIGRDICFYRKRSTIQFSNFDKTPFNRFTDCHLIAVNKVIEESDPLEVDDLVINDVDGMVGCIGRNLLAKPVYFEYLPDYLKKEIIKEKI